jgi:hypothetical protein
MEFDAQIK